MLAGVAALADDRLHAVTETAISGTPQTPLGAHPYVTVGIKGIDVDMDDDYTKILERCMRALLLKYISMTKTLPPEDRPHPPGPGERPDWLLTEVPAYISTQHYRNATRAARVVNAIAAVDRSLAVRVHAALVKDLPALRAAAHRNHAASQFTKAR